MKAIQTINPASPRFLALCILAGVLAARNPFAQAQAAPPTTLGSAIQLNVSTLTANLSGPTGIWGTATDLYVTDSSALTVLKISRSTGTVAVFAGSQGVSGAADGVGDAARFVSPNAVWGDGTYLFVADANRIRKIALATADVTTLTTIGQSLKGVWGDGTNLYVTDSYVHQIYKVVTSTGQSSVFAGNFAGYQDGTGTGASFFSPFAIWGDGTYLYVTHDDTNIRKIEIATRVVTSIGNSLGPIHFAGNGYFRRYGLWGDGTYLYLSEAWTSRMTRVDPAIATFTAVAGPELPSSFGLTGTTPPWAGFANGAGPMANFSEPYGVWGDGTTLYIADRNNHAVRAGAAAPNAPEITQFSPISADVGVTTDVQISGKNFVPSATDVIVSGQGVNVDAVAVINEYSLVATMNVDPSAVKGTRSVQVATPDGISYRKNFTIHQPILTGASPASATIGLTTTVNLTGSGFTPGATSVYAGYLTAASVTVNSHNSLSAVFNVPTTVPEGASTISVSTSVGQSNTLPFTFVQHPAGDATQLDVKFFAGSYFDEGSTGNRFRRPFGLWGDSNFVYATDADSHTLRRVDRTTATVTTLAGVPDTPGFADGPAGTGTFHTPKGLWSDGSYLYVADSENNAIRRITIATGAVTTVVISGVTLLNPTGVWGEGTILYVGDSGNHAVRRIDLNTGATTTLASGFVSPAGLWGNGTDLFIADSGDHTVRKVNYGSGQVSLLAGGPGMPGIVDGMGSAARFRAPIGLWGTGTSLYVADTDNGDIRRIEIATGEVVIVAGTRGASVGGGSLGKGPEALLYQPTALWITGSTAFIADSQNHAVRKADISYLAPELRTASPGIVSRGSSALVTLNGSNFFGNVSVDTALPTSNIQLVDSRTLRLMVTIPDSPNFVGPYTFSVNTPWGRTYTQSVIVDPPSLSSIAPTSGQQGFVTPVTLTGTNFNENSTGVRLSGTGVTFELLSPVTRTSITGQFRIAVDAALGARDVTVETSAGETQPVTFTVLPPPAPSFTGLLPSQGVQGSSVRVTLSGSNFVVNATQVSVDGSGVRADYVSSLNTTTLTAYLFIDPTAGTGTRAVRVITAGGTSGPVNFTVTAPVSGPLSLNPSTASPGSFTNVTISGGDFSASSTVIVNGSGVTVQHVRFVNSATLVATLFTTPGATLGSRAVTVTTQAGPVFPPPFMVVSPTIGQAAQLNLTSPALNPALQPRLAWGDGTSLYVSEYQSIKKIILATGETIPLAGLEGVYGNTADGIGSEARLPYLNAIWGNGVDLYACSSTSVFRINLETRSVTTVVNSPDYACTGLWGDNTNVYIADGPHRAIRTMNLATSAVSTLAEFPFEPITGSAYPTSLWGDGLHLYFSDVGTSSIQKVRLSDGVAVKLPPSVYEPGSLWGDGENLFVGRPTNGQIVKIKLSDGSVTPVAGASIYTCCQDGAGPAGEVRPGALWGDGQTLYITSGIGFNGLILRKGVPVANAPGITAITPTRILRNKQAKIQIKGTQFISGTVVRLYAQSAQILNAVLVDNQTIEVTLTVAVPEFSVGTTGWIRFDVVTSGGTSYTSGLIVADRESRGQVTSQ